MRVFRRIVLGGASVGLLGLGMMFGLPAHASGNVTVSVQSESDWQFLRTCASASQCNVVSTEPLPVFFLASASQSSPLTIYYQVINGTAVDGVDFNVAATGSVTIPAGTNGGLLDVPVVNHGEYGGSRTFTVKITGASRPITIGSPGTETILGGNVPSDCSFTYNSTVSLSLTCTGRPGSQSWYMQLRCRALNEWILANGNNVTGEGTSTATCTEGTIEENGLGFLIINS